MVAQSRKHSLTCASLIADLSNQRNQQSLSNGRRPVSPLVAVSSANLDLKTPIPSYSSPPDRDYFQVASIFRSRATHSRWKEDWEELELLGKGAFGSVVKARNKIDHRIYAVKKIRLRATQTRKDDKIFREVNTLSRLNHRFIVRYFTTWVETSEPISAMPSDSDTENESTSIEDKTASGTGASAKTRRHQNGSFSGSFDPFRVNLDDLGGNTQSQNSFPSIHFGGGEETSTKDGSSGDEDEEEIDGDVFSMDVVDTDGTPGIPSPRLLQRTLYIQMEFVERQTLKEVCPCLFLVWIGMC
jgi:eukaryotic translation initiation factor 2-alpha kinase 4